MNQDILLIDEKDLTLGHVRRFLRERPSVRLADSMRARIEEGHRVIRSIVDENRVVYGVTTGFGKFSDVRIPRDKTRELQKRLVLSHAAGVGDPMPDDVVRLILLLKIKNLSYGHSGVRPELVDFLIKLLNHDILPVIPEKGSVGASGDLAPLAHMSLPVLGEGQVRVNGQTLPAARALEQAGIQPPELEEKEGLALLNGTQAIQAYALYALLCAENLLACADIVGAVSLEGLLGTLTAFDERIHAIRGHKGQQTVAAHVRRILKESPIVASHKESDHRVQDAYCLRCMPQVHGAVRDGFDHVRDVFEREMNGVTDNPLVFPDNGDVLSGGNFHGEPVALAADYLGILMAELASISERRIEHMMDPHMNEMAGFLTNEGGLNSGFMIAHVTAAALVSENKVLAHPASVDSIPTSANKEDHVSMGTHAARKALTIVRNAEYVLAIELLCAMQALDFRKPIAPAHATGCLYKRVRQDIPYWDKDRLMHTDIEKAVALIRKGIVRETVEQCLESPLI